MTGTTAQDFPFDSAVAIVGMSGRFPGANDTRAFWRNLAQGTKSIRFFSDDELLRVGVDPDVLKQPNYVKAGTVIDNVDSFDASFFGFTPREAELMDPQIRLFLECAWEALEDAAVDTETYPGLVGVFAGSALSFYMINNIFSNPDRFAAAGLLQVGILNSADSLSTWVSYKFNLRGPSVAVQTFCSTSLVAVHLACQSLLTYESDMALAGGVAIAIPHGQGYLYQEGGIVSPDGFCRTFDARGQGSVMSNGLGVVALKRLDQAIADGDQIYAVIRGSAVNNDGTMRAGYTAPGLEGQSAVIAEALSNAGVDPDTISYFEAHGTATALGDSIELAATIRAFQERTDRRQFCALGSVKPNIGHLDRAAGVTGLIKTALALHHKQLPPNLDFEQTGTDIDLSSSPFFVNTELREWAADGLPRRAGVSSFGLGGTNAHVVLQETPEQAPSGPSRPQQLLLLSAKTAGALDAATARLAAFLRANPTANLADIAHTLRVGRTAFNHRRVLVCRDAADAVAALERSDPSRLPAVNQAARHSPVAFLFAGVGEHYAGMAQELYESEPTFRATVDQCCAILSTRHGVDLKPVLYPPHQPAGNGSVPSIDFKALLGRTNGAACATGADATPLHQTALAQPAVFVVEYALAQLLTEWGIRPQAMLGYSLGEYVAATLAGVLNLEDALTLVARRAQLIQQLPHGAMLAVSLSEADVQPYLSASVNLAVINSPLTCVLAGPRSDLELVARRLEEQAISCRWLATSHAFHSTMLAPIAEELTALVRTISLRPPQIPYLSNVSGDWITAEEATDPTYWARHLCGTVRFADGVARLLADPQQVLLELGPGQALGSFVKQHPACTRERLGQVLATLPAAHEHADGLARALLALGRMWQAGVTIDWAGLVAHEQRRRVSLPTYPFERQRYWVSPGTGAPNIIASAAPALPEGRKPDIADWFYLPVWEVQPLIANPAAAAPLSPWLVFVDDAGLGAALAQRLERSGATVIRVGLGQDFAQLDPLTFRVRPDEREDYAALFAALQAQQRLPGAITHLWNLAMTTTADAESFQAAQRRGFYSLLHLAQALDGLELPTTLPIMVLSHSTQPVSGDEPLNAEQAPGVAICRVFGQENPSLYCRNVDICVPPAGSAEEHALLDLLLLELTTPTTEPMVAYRAGQRFTQRYRAERLQAPASPHPRLRQQGVYLITGGLGGVGLTLAEYLARTAQARLALVGRSGLPPRDIWDGWLADHGPDDSVSRKIARIRALEALGAEVLILSADVGDGAQLRAAIAAAVERFGELNGVIHGAGYLELAGFQLMRDLNREACEAHFRPKVYGLYLLEEALRDLPLDFCLLISSISAVLGGLRHSAYLAANHFMDLFTHRLRRTQSTCWISVNSDTWQLRLEQRALVGATVAQYEMTAAEGSEAFGRILERGPVQIVNSTGDLDARIRQWVLLETVRAAAPAASAGYDRPELDTRFVAATSAYEQRVAAIWQQVLGINQVGIDDNFFDLGGNSLIALQVIAMLKKEFKAQVPTVALFEAPTVRTMVQYLMPEGAAEADRAEGILAQRRQRARRAGDDGIAIIAMNGRFPGAATVEEFWQNLHDGVEALTYFSDEELLAAGVPPELIHDPNYIKARPVLKDDVGLFDAAFFGYTPREAEFLDPQQRLFQECAWEALELAGYDTQRYKGLVGVFAGANLNLYLMRMFGDPELARSFNDTVFLENDKDALTTNVSYKLNLRGPSFAVQTYCSTSLVAVHIACRSLRSGECDMALAGGVSIRVPVQNGYLYQEGDQVSPDGHCRTFDAQAEGTTFGDGVAVVVLKRLADALADGDTIHAVIRGSAVNNDGGLKVGYTAPSVVGQAEAVTAALADAALAPETISYVEAHGTATRLGDPVEIASLTKAFRTGTDKVGFCAISSTKPYTGHVDRAAGATGLIKTVLALQHEVIPPTLHFQSPNPEIGFADSPFYVTTALTPWRRNGHPRRAGVNALGVGGTNAHVIVEEAPAAPPSGSSRRQQLLLLSAKTASALEAQTANLAAFLRAHPDATLADLAYTLHVGRRVFNHRRALVCADAADALRVLEESDARRLLSWTQPPASRPVAFLFAGVGDHYVGMAQELYEGEPTFRATVDRCCAILTPLLGQPIRRALYPTPLAEAPACAAPALDFKALLERARGATGATGAEAAPLHQTALAQPAVFVVEYALAQLLAEWGIRPQAMLGYSLGEYVAATLAGVLSLDDALALVARRAQLIQRLPHGAMLAVSLGEADVQPYLSATVNLAVINSPLTCVLAGPRPDLEAVAQRLEEQEIGCRWLETSHAFHSAMLAPIAEELTALVRSIPLRPPQIPYLSNVSGDWITAEEATDPTYWARHLCATVRFADGVGRLLAEPQQVLLEVGPGQALGSFVKQHPSCSRERLGQVLASVRGAHERGSDLAYLLTTLGRLWLLDAPIDWEGFSGREQRRRIPLPTYPFERQRFWIEPNTRRRDSLLPDSTARRPDVGDWFTLASWKRGVPLDDNTITPLLAERQCWLLLPDQHGVGVALGDWLRRYGQDVVTVNPAAAFAADGPDHYSVRPDSREDYTALLRTLERQGREPRRVVHLWQVGPSADTAPEAELDYAMRCGFFSLLALAQALGDQGVEQCLIDIVTSDMQEVTGHETLQVARSTVLGPVKVIPQEYANLSTRSIDLALPPGGAPGNQLIEQLGAELAQPSSGDPIALRGPNRWVQTYEPVHIPPPDAATPRLRQGGIYLITGGLGGIGLALADHLAATQQARLALVGRSALPPRERWAEIIAAEGIESGVGRRVHLVQQLEARGAEVLVLQADVADPPQIEAAVQQTLARFGAIHGVLHTAGVPGVGLMQLKTAATAAAELAPKVHGTLALTRALRDVPLDFLVLFSSVTSATGGGPGQVAYCAGNAFLDAYARRYRDRHGLTVAVSWGEWRWDAWSAGLQGFTEDVRAMFVTYRRTFGITFDEGADALRRILSRRFPHVFVTSDDLRPMVEFSKQSLIRRVEAQAQEQSRPAYPRPALGTSYAAPRNQTESAIATIWSTVLGIEPIGVEDNFFELGGNSLLGIDLLARIHRALKIDRLPAYMLYEAPTVSALAEYIAQSQREQMVIDEPEPAPSGEKRQDRLDYFKRRALVEDLA